jgi:hypothetical protein
VVVAEAVKVPVEMETAPVTVVEEAEPSNGTRRHSAHEAHSPRAPSGQEPEKPAAVEAPGGVGTPALARRSVQVVAGREAPGARQKASGSRVAQPKAPSPCRVRQRAPEPRMVQEEAQAPRVVREEAPGPRATRERASGPRVAREGAPETVEHHGNLRERERETCG